MRIALRKCEAMKNDFAKVASNSTQGFVFGWVNYWEKVANKPKPHDECSFIRNALLIINYVQISFHFYMFLSHRYTINVCYFIRVYLSLLYYTTSFIVRDLVQQYIEHGPRGFLISTTNYTYELILSKHKKQRKKQLYILWDIANSIHCLGTKISILCYINVSSSLALMINTLCLLYLTIISSDKAAERY